MKLFLNTDIVPFKAEVVERPWGHYGLYSDNEKCTCKILFIKPNEMLSMQYHFKRAQLYVIMDSDFIVQYSDIPVTKDILAMDDDYRKFNKLEEFLNDHLITVEAKEGDMFGFHEFVIHRTIYRGIREYGRILDAAFGTNDENDIVRICDKYGRSDNK